MEEIEIIERNKKIVETLNEEVQKLKLENTRLTSELQAFTKNAQNKIIQIQSIVDGEKVQLEVKIKYPSANLRTKFLGLQLLHSKELTTFEKKEEGALFKEINNKTLSELNFEEQEIYIKYKAKLLEVQTKYNLKYFKLIIDDSQCTTAEKALLNQEIEGEFYQNLNLEEVEKAVVSFRTSNNI